MKLEFPLLNVKAKKGQNILADAVDLLLDEGRFYIDGANASTIEFGITVDYVEVRFCDISAIELEHLAHLPNATELTLWVRGVQPSPTFPGKKIYELSINIPGVANTLCGYWETDT